MERISISKTSELMNYNSLSLALKSIKKLALALETGELRVSFFQTTKGISFLGTIVKTLFYLMFETKAKKP